MTAFSFDYADDFLPVIFHIISETSSIPEEQFWEAVLIKLVKKMLLGDSGPPNYNLS